MWRDPVDFGRIDSEIILSAVLRFIPVGLLVVDASELVVSASASAARLFERGDAAALVGTSLAELLLDPPDYDGGNKALVRLGSGLETIVGGSRVERR